MPKIHNWMSGLDPDRKLVELWLPGSHDAGVYTDKRNNLNPGGTARCQTGHIGEQADCGSRVFDIRCFMPKGIVHKKTPTMGHFFMDKASAVTGDWGGTLESALDDAVLFLTTWNTEFLIFRIGHTKCTKEVAEVLNATDNGKMKYKNFILWGDRGNLVDLQVKDLKGKLLLVFDKEFHKDFKVGDGYYPYLKYPDIPKDGLSFCGKYTGDLATAAQTIKKNKGNWSAEGAVKNAEEASEEHTKHYNPKKPDHLWWVYWQETGGNVYENTTAKMGMHNRLDNFLSKFRTGSLPHPNVIGHDFVNKVTCGAIVKMNRDLASTLETYRF